MTIREDPPPESAVPFTQRARAERIWAERLAGCIADPGQWYRLTHDYSPQELRRMRRAADVRAGAAEPIDGLPILPPGRWEFRAETIKRGTRKTIWARKLPEEAS